MMSRAVVFAVLMPEAALYYGLLMAKVSPDVALIPFAVAMLWALVRLQRERRCALVAGGRPVRRAGAAVEIHRRHAAAGGGGVHAGAGLARRWLRSPYPWAGGADRGGRVPAGADLECQHDWASFRFQFVRAAATHRIVAAHASAISIGLQFGLVGFILLPVVLSGVALTAWRGYRQRDAGGHSAVDRRDRSLRLFLLEIADACGSAIPGRCSCGRPDLPPPPSTSRCCRAKAGRHGWSNRPIAGRRVAIASGIAFVVGVFSLLCRSPLEFHRPGRSDRRRGGL